MVLRKDKVEIGNSRLMLEAVQLRQVLTNAVSIARIDWRSKEALRLPN
jgi:hypothetical protein